MRWPYSYLDPSGDAAGGPDVTKIETGGDLATGQVGIRLTVLHYAADSGFDIYFDTDQNRATGTRGFEYMLVQEGNTWWWDTADGANGWKGIEAAPASFAVHDGTFFSYQLSTADLGGSAYFNFQVVTFTIAPGDATPQVLTANDRAPDRGGFDLSLNAIAAAAHPPPVIAPLGTTPKHPGATKPFTASYALTDPETRQPAIGAKVHITMRIAGKKLPTTTSFRDGVLVSRTRIPAGTRGKRLVVNVVAGTDQVTNRQDIFRIG